MTQITITVLNESEANWILDLLKRLQVKYEAENEESTRNRAKEIIRQGADTLNTSEMTKYLQDTRQDRPLPLRAQ